MIKVTSGDPVAARIQALRAAMADASLDACIIPTGDPHMSEYISDHYKVREFLTGFTGSAGTAVITADEAALWTDSRYFLQAEKELDEDAVTLYRAGIAGTPKIHEFLKQKLSKGCRVSVDGRLVSGAWADDMRRALGALEAELITDADPAGQIWEDRPALKFGPVHDYPVEYAGADRKEKIQIIREDMKRAGADVLILSGLSDTAWLMNLRGSDIKCNPVFFSFLILTDTDVRLYADETAFDIGLIVDLRADGVEIVSYDVFYDHLKAINGRRVMLDKRGSSEHILRSLPADVAVIDHESPVMLRKCVKNPTEIRGIYSAHLKDGVAVCRFLYWLKGNVALGTVDEISAAQKLHEFRAEQKLFMGDSFDAIVGYGPNGAIVHYSADSESNTALRPEGLVLIDSGGQYLDGTTDITRTVVLGPLTDQEKTMFTAVLRGHIDLAKAIFPEGLNGNNLDYLAHAPLWEMGLDYRHGTGHGVGHYLNVHEDPNRIHWTVSETAPPAPAFEEGMLTSDEPGYYEEGKFGIRHESLILCLEAEKTEYGRFMRFDEVSLAPFDLEGILPEQMQQDEIDYLNSYHRKVYEKIAPFLNEQEREWLREATRGI